MIRIDGIDFPVELEADAFSACPEHDVWIQKYLDFHCVITDDAVFDVVIPVMHKDRLEIIVCRDLAEYRRFIISDDLVWDPDSERQFEQILLQDELVISKKYLKKVYARYRKRNSLNLHFPDDQPQLLLAHIYYALHGGTAKELLYKAHLHQLAAHLEELECVDLSGHSPKDIFDGMTVRTLRALNSKEGVRLLASRKNRTKLLELQRKQAWMFKKPLNIYQAQYLQKLLESCDPEIVSKYRRYHSILATFRYDYSYQRFLRFFHENWLLRTRFDFSRAEKELTKKNVWSMFARTHDVYSCIWESSSDAEDEIYTSAENHTAYEYEDDKYTVTLPRSSSDFCQEAIAQSSCVIHYIPDVTRGSSIIAFLRPTTDRYTPFVTLEIYRGYILQAKGKNDSAPPAEVQEWLRQYADKHHLIIHEKAYVHAGQYYV